MAFSLNQEARSSLSIFTGKREEFPPPQDGRAPLLAPAFCKNTSKHRQSRQATAVPNFHAPLAARPACLLRANEVLTAKALVSPRPTFSQGLEQRVEVPHMGEAGAAVTAPIFPTPTSITSLRLHLLPGTCPGPGAAGAGKGRAGAGRSVYIASNRGVGAAASPRDTKRREAAEAASFPFRGSGGPHGFPAGRGTGLCAPGSALRPLSARPEKTRPGLGKHRAGDRVDVSPR